MENVPLFGFVVLHYQAEAMTRTCVDCLLVHHGRNNINIVIVDNGSPNGSGALLQQRYEEDPRVHVLLTGKNLGFAAGNNVGYQYLRNNYDCDFVVVMNNDVLIEQDDFIDAVRLCHERTGFAVLGPDIYEPGTKRHRNPYRLEGYTKQEAEQLLESMQRWNERFAPRYAMLLRTGAERRAATMLKQLRGKTQPWEQPAADVMLQGSCYVFSRTYLDVRSIAFCPDTFLYFEEAILYRDCQKLGLAMLYDPSVRVIHLGSVSTSTTVASRYAQEKAKNERHLASVKLFIDRYDDFDVASK